MWNMFQDIREREEIEATRTIGTRTKALKALQMQNVFQGIRVCGPLEET